MPILSMNRSEKSLEDIFMELTETEEAESEADQEKTAGTAADETDSVTGEEETDESNL